MVATQTKYCPKCCSLVWAYYLACPRCGYAFADISVLLDGIRWLLRLVRGG